MMMLTLEFEQVNAIELFRFQDWYIDEHDLDLSSVVEVKL